MVRTRLVAATAEDTRAAGERLGRTLVGGEVIALTGALGAGKTCFVQGLARGIGIAAPVTSPTFVLVNEYRGRLAVHHVDAYRTERPEELVDVGLLDLFGDDGVTVVEWADRAAPLIPANAIRVDIQGVGDEPREITIETPEGTAEPPAPSRRPPGVSNGGH